MYEAVFAPLAIRGAVIPNRIVRTAHGVGLHGEALIAYHEARAKGGVGLSIIGSGGVHGSNPNPAVPAHCDDALPFYTELSRRCHRHGMLVFQQLNHKGACSPGPLGDTQWSSSAVPNPIMGTVPQPLNLEMIGEITRSFGVAAARVREGGMDGVEIHAAHNYLIGQFLSPALNQRVDEYGGSLDNRMRFLREVVQQVRSHVGDDFPVSVRLVAQDGVPGGLSEEECIGIAEGVQQDVDIINVSMGGYWAFHRMLGTMELPLGYELPVTTRLSERVSVPTIVTGRIMTLDHAQYIIESGVADLVSMVRATIADPDLVAKARSGRGAQIRPCIGTSQACVAGIFTPSGFGCVVNPEAGKESIIPTPSFVQGASGETPSVLVVGGGPAVMEAARVAALRGFTVELHERRRELGGQLALAASVEARRDMAAVGSWLESEISRLGVDIHRNSYVDPDLVASRGADIVVIATGGESTTSAPQVRTPGQPIPGSGQSHVQSAWQALSISGQRRVTGRVVLFDDTGAFEAISVGLRLVANGHSPTIVTRHDFLGARVPFPPATLEASRERLMAADVTLVGGHRIVEIRPNCVSIASIDSGRERVVEADSVILCLLHVPNRGLSEELRERGIDHYVIGDAQGTMELQRAMSEANLLARSF